MRAAFGWHLVGPLVSGGCAYLGAVTAAPALSCNPPGRTHPAAQAVAAMAWGTQSCPKVDKILGPGNQFVTVGGAAAACCVQRVGCRSQH